MGSVGAGLGGQNERAPRHSPRAFLIWEIWAKGWYRQAHGAETKPLSEARIIELLTWQNLFRVN